MVYGGSCFPGSILEIADLLISADLFISVLEIADLLISILEIAASVVSMLEKAASVDFHRKNNPDHNDI